MNWQLPIILKWTTRNNWKQSRPVLLFDTTRKQTPLSEWELYKTHQWHTMGTLQRFPTTSNHDSKASNLMTTRIAQPSAVNRFANISTLRHTTFELFSSYGHGIKDLVYGPINKDLSNNTPLDSSMYLNSFSMGEKTMPLIDKAPFTKMSSGQPYQRRRLYLNRHFTLKQHFVVELRSCKFLWKKPGERTQRH